MARSGETLDHDVFLRRALAVAQRSRDGGNHPFGAILVGPDGTVLLEAENSCVTTGDRTGHAERNLASRASVAHDGAFLAQCTLYSSAEPCAMCAGATYWVGIGRVVYALSEKALAEITGPHPENLTMALGCRRVFAAGQRPVEVIGPRLEDEARAVHAGFWEALMGFLDTITIPDAPRYWIQQARVPQCFLAVPVEGWAPDKDGAVLVDLLIDGADVGRIVPAGAGGAPDLPAIDLAGRHVWPSLIDMHAHIDKGHVIPRIENPDGSFAGARQATTDDRQRHWQADDVRRRMGFALRCAYAHGVAGIRTHIDSHEGSAETSWGVFRDLRTEWADRVALQAASLVPIDVFREPYAVRLADLVARSGGVLGGVTRATGGVHQGMLADTDALLDTLFRLAAERGLNVDLHVDESGDPEAAALPRVALAVMRNKFRGTVVCGHCCSLSLQPEEHQRQTLALCADAGVAVVTLPTVNMYLQDRTVGRTPRWRGVTLIQEMRRAGIPVAVGGDNCRDPFYAYGDHDMVDTLRQAVKIAHLDHPIAEVPAMAGPVPSAIIGAGPLGTIAAGGPARLILFAARTLNELVCRPQADRIVLDRGRRVLGGLPDYAELDAQ